MWLFGEFMKANDKRVQIRTRKKSELFITFLGYFWIIFSVVVSVWQLVDFLFKPQIFSPWTWILCFGIPIISIVLAIILTIIFPIFLSRLDVCGSDDKYFKLSTAEQMQNLKSTLYMCVSSDDERLLNSIIVAIQEKRYDDAVKLGRNNSRVLHVFGENVLRLKNGVFTYYALNECVKGKKKSIQDIYIENYLLVNDIGLCLIKLSENDKERLKTFAAVDGIFKEFNKIFNLKFEQDISILQMKGYNICGAIKEKLKDKPKYYKLVAQAIRHQLYYKINNKSSSDILRLNNEFSDIVNKISNPFDKLEMDAYLHYINAELVFKFGKNETDQTKIDNAITEIDKAKVMFEKIGDEVRAAKCFKIKAELLLILSKLKETDVITRNMGLDCFKEGAIYSIRVARYEEAVKIFRRLIECGDDSMKMYAKNELTRLGRGVD